MSPAPDDRLDSWKEIAAYVNRGVRTVRRWEDEEGLPVHRHLHRTHGTVYAYKSEIDTWRSNAARTVARRPLPEPATDRSLGISIAVLPFTNLSPDPGNEYFADGLTDEVTTDLSKVRALRVTSRTSAMTFKNTIKDVKTIAGELGVRYVLQGSVRRTAGRLRITAQLIDASSDAHVWADKYDGTDDDVFAFQERLARVIVSALELRLSTDEDRRLAERPVADVHAYDCYLRARQESWRWRKDAIDRAVELLHQGLRIEPESAGLHAALGLAHLQYREAGIDMGPQPLQDADACARRVCALQPGSAAGLQLRGWIDYSRGRIQEAVRDLKAALETDPNNADTLGLLANCCLISGKAAAARPLIARLLAVDPLTPLNVCMPGFADIMEGRFDTAIEPYRRSFEMDPGNPMARMFYVWVLILNERPETAEEISAAFPAEIRDAIPARIARFLVRALAGDGEGAHALVAPDVEALASAGDMFPRFLAQGYALAGLFDRSLHWLEIAVHRGFINHPFLSEHDPFLKPLRTEPRFIALMAATRERWLRFEV